ncbi:MAG TPA: antibiotic biosynthesis monooxygenase [Chitinophagaceae bacterium]|nr:antibiotic biosynthesis monooxygenase [Chitinophagaceae bacterium]
MYFHKVSGTIPENKHKEFEQTFSFVGTNLPVGCAGIEFSRDIENLDRYHFISFWEHLNSMEHFTHSTTHVILLGAFRTLGELNENKIGIMIEIN